MSHQKLTIIESSPYSPSIVAYGAVISLHTSLLGNVRFGIFAKMSPFSDAQLYSMKPNETIKISLNPKVKCFEKDENVDSSFLSTSSKATNSICLNRVL